MLLMHHDDMDGRAAAFAIFYSAKKPPEEDVTLVEMSYTKEVPLDGIEEGEQVRLLSEGAHEHAREMGYTDEEITSGASETD